MGLVSGTADLACNRLLVRCGPVALFSPGFCSGFRDPFLCVLVDPVAVAVKEQFGHCQE